MKSAYLYVRVSTDEQKKKGYSLPEQEDRLLKHCEQNQIAIKGIFREDFSAKDFNRPEWKKIIKKLKENRRRPPENILFIKWDRFSRSIEYAYQMLGVLRGLNTRPMAIDQPIDFDVPESIVMLAVYLSIPEAENNRRGKNASDGMRRSRKMGMWPGRAPMGYANQSTPEGRKVIVPKQPQADLIRWAFEQFAKGTFSISQVRGMVCQRGLQCSSNNFWKILRNPIYCGLITIKATKDEELHFVKGAHDAIISEKLFREVQLLLENKRKKNGTNSCMKFLFPLRTFISCPYCGLLFTGSTSQGRRAKYRYYHCKTSRCKGRYRADGLEASYEDQLKKVFLAPGAYDLFNMILEDENILSARRKCLDDRKDVATEISLQQEMLSRARRGYISGKLDFEDFRSIKTEYKGMIDNLNERLIHIGQKIEGYDSVKGGLSLERGISLFQPYAALDIVGKIHIARLLTPTSIEEAKGTLNPLSINRAIRKIVMYNTSNRPIISR